MTARKFDNIGLLGPLSLQYLWEALPDAEQQKEAAHHAVAITLQTSTVLLEPFTKSVIC